MSISYQEITNELLIPDCVSVQKDIFNLSEKDAFPAAFLSLIIRKEHPLGMLVGCFKSIDGKDHLIGLAAFMYDSNPNSLYCPFMGVKSEYRDGVYGYKLLCKIKEIAQQKGIEFIYGIYDPLEANLGKIYSRLGFVSTKYLQKPYKLCTPNVIQLDKVLFEWNLSDNRTTNSTKSYNNLTFSEALKKLCVATNTQCTDPSFLIEIPTNYLQLTNKNKSLANKWRTSTQELFNEYINNQGYRITNCLSGRIDSEQKAYYQLQKN